MSDGLGKGKRPSLRGWNELGCVTRQTAKETVMRQAAVCPDLMQYQQLAADKLADADEEAMLQHLERCEACARKVSTLVERDRLVEFIRRYQARGDGAADEGMGRLIERMSKLRPGETQSAAAQTTSSAHNTVPVAALIIACPACGKDLKVKGEFAGKLVKCPHCQQAVCAAAKSAVRRRPAFRPSLCPCRLGQGP